MKIQPKAEIHISYYGCNGDAKIKDLLWAVKNFRTEGLLVIDDAILFPLMQRIDNRAEKNKVFASYIEQRHLGNRTPQAELRSRSVVNQNWAAYILGSRENPGNHSRGIGPYIREIREQITNDTTLYHYWEILNQFEGWGENIQDDRRKGWGCRCRRWGKYDNR